MLAVEQVAACETKGDRAGKRGSLEFFRPLDVHAVFNRRNSSVGITPGVPRLLNLA